MGKYRKIDPKIWNDSKFMSLSDNGKLVFFFLLTHPHMTSLGAMRASVPGLASEIGWKEKAFREAFLEAFRKGMVKADEKASFIWLPNFLKYNRPESPNVVKSWVASMDLLPECGLKVELIQALKDFLKGLPEAFHKAIPEGFLKALLNQEQEQEHKQEQDSYMFAGSDEDHLLAEGGNGGSPSVKESPLPYKGDKIVFDYKTGKFLNITDELVSKWRGSFPVVDIATELGRMEAWCLANPKNRKSNWHRFIVNWLMREQDRARTKKEEGWFV